MSFNWDKNNLPGVEGQPVMDYLLLEPEKVPQFMGRVKAANAYGKHTP